MKIQSVFVGISVSLIGLAWTSVAELKEQNVGEWDPSHHHHHHHRRSSHHHRRPCHKSSDSHCLDPFAPPHRHSHGHHHPHHHHSHSSHHHYHDHCPPEEAQAKVLQLTSQIQAYLSTCPLGPWPSDLFNPFATIGIYGRHCSNLNLSGCCYMTANLTAWLQDLYSGLCQVSIPITWINQQPPSAEILCNGTAAVTFVEVRHTALTLDTHQIRYYWQRRIGCDYWLQYVESKDVSCPVFDDLPACSNCPPP